VSRYLLDDARRFCCLHGVLDCSDCLPKHRETGGKKGEYSVARDVVAKFAMDDQSTSYNLIPIRRRFCD
jgi:hypothetical protein